MAQCETLAGLANAWRCLRGNWWGIDIVQPRASIYRHLESAPKRQQHLALMAASLPQLISFETISAEILRLVVKLGKAALSRNRLR